MCETGVETVRLAGIRPGKAIISTTRAASSCVVEGMRFGFTEVGNAGQDNEIGVEAYQQ
jgi:hypothetical protein